MLTLTYVRKRTLQAVRAEPGRYYLEAGNVYDAKTGRKHTAEFRKLIVAGWLRVADESEKPHNWLPNRRYYKVTETGEALLGVQKGQS